MAFTKFTIERYRGYRDLQELNFAVPDNHNPGSGITYIVGENNSGKTTLIEGLFLKAGARIRNSELQTDEGPRFTLYEDANLVRAVSLIRPGSSTLQESAPLTRDNRFEIVASRRHWSADVNQTINSYQEFASYDRLEAPRDQRILQEASSFIPSIFASIEKDGVLYQKFIEEVKKVLPDFSSFTVAFENSDYINYRTIDGVQHRSDMLGDGVISVLRIFAHLISDTDTRPLVIDEPELSLHPSAQKRLKDVLEDHSTKRQIIIATHSPYLISWKAIENGAKLNRVSKPNDGISIIKTLQDYSVYRPLVNGANWQQPFLMDIVSKEVFFNDRILFTEGQEDVGLLTSNDLIDSSVNLFGYGVRGFNSFKIALQLAKDLGINKAAALIDGGDNETVAATDLIRDFPEYKIIQLNREDIRDKPEYNTKAKQGYFTERGQIKPSGDLDDFTTKISELNDYFSTNL